MRKVIYWYAFAFELLGGVAAALLRLTGGEGWAYTLAAALLLLAVFYFVTLAKPLGERKSVWYPTERIIKMAAAAGLAVCSLPMVSKGLPQAIPFLLCTVWFLLVGILYASVVRAVFQEGVKSHFQYDTVVGIVVTLSDAVLLLFSAAAIVDFCAVGGGGFAVRWQLPVGLFALAGISCSIALAEKLTKRKVIGEFNRRVHRFEPLQKKRKG